MLKDITGFKGQIRFDTEKPDGTMRKVLDITLIKSMGWEPKISLRDGLSETYDWYQKNKEIAKQI